MNSINGIHPVHSKTYVKRTKPCKCGGQGSQYVHTCPIASEIRNSKTTCNCCDACTQNCSDDI